MTWVDELEAEAERLRSSRALWVRSFNRLEKAVTNHIKDRCIDSDDLEHVHKALMRDLGPKGEGSA
ncbi:MAG TPA: hypothetical protein VK631_00130 [Solirubrobacteraceae bacterium]|nr:hypothetical protein [Solirubrobacteraceae bacterium]